ncbi:MAG: hypothetical protein M3433_07715 [Actinomycetota bacterium]|nr:hypothetical protein [Actinomycetota bacterium]MDQ3648454.1 hypothetical protein [Actinomycetota bacterium]
MHAVVVQATLHDFEAGRTFLREEVVPQVSQAPGFVAAYWVGIEEDQGRSMLVFESEDAARGVANQIASPPNGAVTVDSVDVGEVVEHA